MNICFVRWGKDSARCVSQDPAKERLDHGGRVARGRVLDRTSQLLGPCHRIVVERQRGGFEQDEREDAVREPRGQLDRRFSSVAPAVHHARRGVEGEFLDKDAFDDTWAFDAKTNTWTELSPPTTASPRGWHLVASHLTSLPLGRPIKVA